MKKNVLFVLLLLATITPVLSQTTHTITLYVNTAEITRAEDAYMYAYFEGQQEGVDTREFTTLVNPGDVVVWRAVSISSEADRVMVEMINYQGGDNLFDDCAEL